MSKNHKKGLKLDNRMRAEIKHDKEVCSRIYMDWKSKCLLGVHTKDTATLRESIFECMKLIKSKCKSHYSKIAYGRAFLIMLNRVGGVPKDADDLFDEAMGKTPDGPSEESIQEAMKMLGMEPPTNPAGTSPDAPAGSRTSPPSDSAGTSRLPSSPDAPVSPGE